jgi:hypothetical protein
MSDIEDRLRAELWAQAQRTQAEDLRELQVQPRREPAGARRRWWLAPAAAALAVAAVVGVIAGVRPTAGRQPPAVSAAGQRPPFYVTLPADGNSGHPDATVRATATGAMLGRVSVPGTHFSLVAAAADDRTFVLAAFRPAASSVTGHGGTEFYRFTLSARGRPGPLVKLPLTVSEGRRTYGATSMALSADGATLAVAVVPRAIASHGGGPTSRIEVVSLRTGRTRTWTSAVRTDIESLSWVRGGTLAYLVPGPPAPAGGLRLRLLDTAGPSGSLPRSSRPVTLRGVTGQLQSAMVTGHGQFVVAWTQAPAPAGRTADTVLAEFSAHTGLRLRVLDTIPSRGAFETSAQVWSADPSGEHLLAGGNTVTGRVMPGGVVKDPVVRAFLHRIDRGRVTALPDPGNLLLAAAW